MCAVSESYTDVTSGKPFASSNRHIVDFEIAVFKNKTIETLSSCKGMICGMNFKRDFFAAATTGPDGGIDIFPANHVASVPDCWLNFGYERSNTRIACGSNRNGERLGLLFEESLKKPICGKFEWETEVVK